MSLRCEYCHEPTNGDHNVSLSSQKHESITPFYGMRDGEDWTTWEDENPTPMMTACSCCWWAMIAFAGALREIQSAL